MPFDALPSRAVPSSAVPSRAVPSSAVPAGALARGVPPSGALASDAAPASPLAPPAVPSAAPRSAALPSRAASPDAPADRLHGLARADLVAHALARLPAALRAAVARIELQEAPRFVNLGVHFDRIAWRAVFAAPGLPAQAGEIVLHDGEVVQ